MATSKTDLLIVGGGLAGGLIASAMASRRPELAVTLVEAGPTIGGNHIWSFFDSDVAAQDMPLVAPLVSHRWAGHDVRFPGHERCLPGGYNAIRSERLDARMRAILPNGRVLMGMPAIELDRGGALLADGRRLEARGVIDARGAASLPGLDLGWQKFVGRLLRLEAPHGLTRATIMDATVDQTDGYRFVYLLPFGSDRLFVEDTYYTSGPELDPDRIGGRIDAYVRQRGWRIAAVEREEMAALPIAMGGNIARLWEDGKGVAKAGMAAGLFQPMTGYSLPDAVRTARAVAALPDPTSDNLFNLMKTMSETVWRERGFYRLLARMLFRAADPADRWRVLARFYKLDHRLIERFYAGRSTALDKLRILAGKPPVPVGRALGVLRESVA